MFRVILWRDVPQDQVILDEDLAATGKFWTKFCIKNQINQDTQIILPP